MATLTGRAFKYGDHVNTDVIIPARYLSSTDPAELAPHCLEDLDPAFVNKVRAGDIVVAGRNFGCGSSREHAPLAIKGCGVSCVIAESFARIFYRNAFNVGLPIFECAGAAAATETADELEVDTETGQITNRRTGETFQAQPLAGPVKELVEAGGLAALVRRRLASR
jgi:3-isopropylmalate dehydratase small subunit